MAQRGKPSKLDRDQLWDFALRSLGRRAQSANEVRQKLARRASDPADVAGTMERLREYGFTDDTRFSEAFASSRLQNQGFGAQRVLRDLSQKRVSKGVAAAAVEQVYAGRSEDDLVQDFLRRKYKGKDLKTYLADHKNVGSAYRRLRLAGFSSSASLRALKQHAAGLPEDDWAEEPDEDGSA